jgi:hypothetical protein
MSSREERMALNEAASREINEKIEGVHQDDPPSRRMRIACECALKSCEHFIGDIERIVFENDRFAVVAKRAGTPADVVTETDPRN